VATLVGQPDDIFSHGFFSSRPSPLGKKTCRGPAFSSVAVPAARTREHSGSWTRRA
jgi:hypothetical protein